MCCVVDEFKLFIESREFYINYLTTCRAHSTDGRPCVRFASVTYKMHSAHKNFGESLIQDITKWRPQKYDLFAFYRIQLVFCCNCRSISASITLCIMLSSLLSFLVVTDSALYITDHLLCMRFMISNAPKATYSTIGFERWSAECFHCAIAVILENTGEKVVCDDISCLLAVLVIERSAPGSSSSSDPCLNTAVLCVAVQEVPRLENEIYFNSTKRWLKRDNIAVNFSRFQNTLVPAIAFILDCITTWTPAKTSLAIFLLSWGSIL